MNCPRHSETSRKENSGVALFMVISAMFVLSIIVSELIYTTKVSERMAFMGIDQLKSYYLAKGAFKIALLRLKAYQTLNAFTQSAGNLPISIPKKILNMIWSQPLIFPIPTALPGLSLSDRESIDKFQKESSMEGSFSMLISPGSDTPNLNMILPYFELRGQSNASSSASSTASSTGGPAPSASPSTYDPALSRQFLQEYIGGIIQDHANQNEQFADEFRDLKTEELMDEIYAWADYTYDPQFRRGNEIIKPKGAPFYTINELHMLNNMDDQIFDLIAPRLSVMPTPGINVNTIEKTVLKVLLQGHITDEEIQKFYEYRDHPETGQLFKEAKDFFDYIGKNVAYYTGSPNLLTTLQDDYTKKGIFFITDEANYKITITASLNSSLKVLEAWVRLMPTKNNTSNSGNSPSNAPTNNQGGSGTANNTGGAASKAGSTG